MRNKIIASLVTTVLLCTVVACFDEFDPNSYKPAFTINGFSSTDEIKLSALVAYWPFDGSLRETVSGQEALNSGTNFANGFKGQALNLNVANKSYVTFNPGAAITGLQSFTISFWVNPVFVDQNSDNGIDGILGLVNLSNPTGFWGNIDWFVENGSNPTSARIVAHVVSGANETWMSVANYRGLFDGWTNHTLTYNSTTSQFKYYINGSVGATATAGWTGPIQFTGSGPMVFGAVQFQTNPSIGCCGNQPWASYLTGQLDEVRIYNSALTDDEVRALVVLQGKGK